MSMNVWRVDAISFTRSQFFRRIAHCAFRELPYAVDEYAPIIVATTQALRNNTVLHHAFENTTALKKLHEGGILLGEHATLAERYPHLARIEKQMFARSRISFEAALVLTLGWFKERKDLPPGLLGVDEVVFDGIFDFSPCELEILFRLAELSLPLRFVLPLDRKPRGLLLVVQDLLSQLEARAPSLPIAIETPEIVVAEPIIPFFDAIFDSGPCEQIGPVRTLLASHFDDQVDWVCEQIETLQGVDATTRIAVAFRTMDSRVRWFEDALRRRRSPYRIGSGLALGDLFEAKAVMRHLGAGMERNETPKEKTLSEHLQDAISLDGVSKIRSMLQYIADQVKDETRSVALHDFYHWLKSFFARREVSFAASAEADAVELVSVKQLWTRKYDYVFLVDLAQGRFPKPESLTEAFNDQERFSINQVVGRRVLPFLIDDPLEESTLPTRQAFESLWFVGAMASAQKGLFLSSSSQDPKGREQAPSEFLIAAGKVVGFYEKGVSAGFSPRSPKVGEGDLALAKSGEGHGFQDDGTQGINPPFHLEPVRSKEVFARWLGLNASHPLTPTRLEAFAECPFRALVERIFDVEKARDGDEIDPRTTGRFAHAVLETFFRTLESAHHEAEGLSASGREFLKTIIESKKAILVETQAKISPSMLKAQVLWLSLVIERAISNLLKNPPVHHVVPRYFESALGFGDQSVSLPVSSERVYLGGIVDRIDEGSSAFAIIDYKMSSAMALRQKMNDREFLESHFQLPLYARLLLSAHPAASEKDIYAYLISIRDGTYSQILGQDVVQDFKERVLNDAREDGLAAAIRRVMTPVLNGEFLAKPSESCTHCHLKSVCRV